MEILNQKKLVGPCVICGIEGYETKFQRFTEDAKRKALQHKTLDPTWQLGSTQFCHNHYMSCIVNGTYSENSEDTITLKR
jgi:hypothetical protein